MARTLPISVALSCLWRTAAVNAAMTARGMQQLGLVFILAPALRHLYPDHDDRARAFARYTGHTNTHAFMMPGYAGLLISLEEEVAAGRMPPSVIATLRQTLATTLSALGDGFFSGAVHTLWALVTICMLLQGWIIPAAVFAVTLVVLLFLFRVCGFFYCLGHGIAALQWIGAIDLISWTGRVKVLNALLIMAMLLILLFRDMLTWEPWARIAVFFFIAVASWLVGRLHVGRFLLWIFALFVFVLHDYGYIAV